MKAPQRLRQAVNELELFDYFSSENSVECFAKQAWRICREGDVGPVFQEPRFYTSVEPINDQGRK